MTTTQASDGQASSLRWNDDIRSDGHPGERSFCISYSAGLIHGAVWFSTLPGPRPLVLFSHGGSGHCRSPAVRQSALHLMAQGGFHVVCIDGPVHGGRSTVPHLEPAQVLTEFRSYWRTGDGGREGMVRDWKHTLDALTSLPNVDSSRIGFMGLSMGTAYGLPLCGQEPRIRASVLGLWAADHPNSGALLPAARLVAIPVLFVQKLVDELMSRDGQFLLFENLASKDKQLSIYPGRHGDFAPWLNNDACTFLCRRLYSA